MEHGPKKRWSLFRSAGLAALVGIGAALVHTLFHTFGGAPFDEDPLVHVLLDYAGFISAGVLVLVILAAIRNRLF
jgi:hypothetical protein